MKKIVMIGFLLMIAVAILSGCASIKHELIFQDNQKVEINMHPVTTAAIPFRNYNSDQECVVVLNDFLLNSRCNEFTIRWEVIGLDAEGNVFSGVLFSELKEKTPDNQFYGHCKVKAPERESIRIIILDAGGSLGSNGLGKGFAVYKNLMTSKEYLKELYTKGTPLSELPDPKEFDEIIGKWNKFRVPINDSQVKIITPWSREIIENLCKINTDETVTDRINSSKLGVYFPKPVGTLVGLVKDAGHIFFGSYKGCGDIYPENNKLSRLLIEEARENAVVRIYRKEN